MNVPSHCTLVRNILVVTTVLLFCSCLVAPALMAETRYIKPNLKVTVYLEQSTSSQIITSIWVGEAVQVIQNDMDWTRIRLDDGTEGWVHSHFLAPAPLLPVGIHAATLESINDPDELQNMVRNLIAANEQLRQETATGPFAPTSYAGSGQTMTNDSTSPLSIPIPLDETLRQLEEIRVENAALQIENSVLKKNESIKWFMVGSGTLLFGWLIGRFRGSGSRRRKPSLL